MRQDTDVGISKDCKGVILFMIKDVKKAQLQVKMGKDACAAAFG